MSWKILADTKCEIPVDNSIKQKFFQVVEVFLTKQHTVNRKLSTIKNLKVIKSDVENLENVLEKIKTNLEKLDAIWPDSDALNDIENQEGLFISIDILIPRSKKFQSAIVLTVLDLQETSIHVLPLSTNDLTVDFEYKIVLEANHLKILTEIGNDSNWLKFTLLDKFRNWLENCDEGKQSLKSNHLIDALEYQELYSSFKEKYGIRLVEIWPEITDPKKFVYEDLAIAAYLILFWKQEESNSKQTFVDLGCGNGLLVYILAMEGYKGCGIDLRRRKIWDFYPKSVDLREQSIVPSDEFLFPECDYIIGNHSDELSPWIPIIAARSSYHTNFFLLPCCPYELNGTRYIRTSCKSSQYLEYVDYLSTVSGICKFKNVQIDRLKIPSTKRICIIGTGRNYNEENFKGICQNIQSYIDERCQNTSGDSWATDFKPRVSVEKVRNCTTVDKTLTLEITRMIFDKLLEQKVDTPQYPGWNCGTQLDLLAAVSLIDKEKLKSLKAECGGLQTLLRNNYQAFQVNQGTIRIRIPEKSSDRKFTKDHKKNELIKSKPCFFFQYHPHGCPLTEEDCCYRH